MNNLITTPAKPFADLELVPLQRQSLQRTGLEEILAAAYRQRFVIAVALALALAAGIDPNADVQAPLYRGRLGSA